MADDDPKTQLARAWWQAAYARGARRTLPMLTRANIENHQTRLALLVQERDDVAALTGLLRRIAPDVDWDAQDSADLLRRAKAVLAKEFQPEAHDA